MTRLLVFRPAALKDLQRLDHGTQTRILEALGRLSKTEYGDVKKLRGEEAQFHLRVGKWRVFFRYESPDLLIVRGIDNRGEAY